MTINNAGLIISALQATDADLARRIDAANSWKAGLIKQGARVRLFRAYERGDHRAKVTDQMKAFLRIESGDDEMNDFAINQCETIINKEAALIYVTNISVDDTAQKWLKETLERNSFSAMHVEDISSTLRDGNAYTMVGTNALWTSEPEFDGFSGLVVIYSPQTRLPIWACKLWSEENIDPEEDAPEAVMRVVVYQDSGVSYFLGDVGGQEIKPDASEHEGGKKAWGIDYIPIVTYANKAKNYTKSGQSELRNAISPQDIFNRTLHSMMAAIEGGGFPLRWSIGIEVDQEGVVPAGIINLVLVDGNGEPKTEFSSDDIEFMKSVRVGQFEAIEIGQFFEALDKIIIYMGYSTQTPLLGITPSGGISGDALRQLNSSLVSKATRYTQQNTDAYKRLIRMTADMQNKFDTGLGDAPQIGSVDIAWADVEITNTDQRLATIGLINEKLPNIISVDAILKEVGSALGWDKAKIDEEIEKAKERQGLEFDVLTGAAGNAPIVA